MNKMISPTQSSEMSIGRLGILCGFWSVLLLISAVNIFIDRPIFNSQDESANYTIVREYGLNGRMYVSEKYLDIDTWNNLHPRWLLTLNSKLVPFNFLWVPLFYWPYYSYLWDNTRFINLIFAVILVTYLLKISELFKISDQRNSGIVLISVLWCFPLIFYFNFPYYNVVPFISFIVPFLYYWFKFNQSGLIKHLYLAIIFALMAIWMRYEQVIFVWLFAVVNFLYNKRSYLSIRPIHVVVGSSIFFILFIVPLMVLNTQLYWDPLSYWYSVFTKTFFAEDRTWSLMRSLTWIFFPSQKFDTMILWNNIKNNLFLMFPIFYLGWFIAILNSKKIPWWWSYVAISTYAILYAWMSPTYLSWVDSVDLRSSMNRYWIFIHIIAIILFFSWMQKIRYRWTKFLLLIWILCALYGWAAIKYLEREITSRRDYALIEDGLLQRGIRNNYVITPLHDKFLFWNNKVIGWWWWLIDSDEHFNKSRIQIVSTVTHLLKNGEPVYALETKWFTRADHFIFFESNWIGFQNIDWNIYKLFLKNPNE